MRQFAPLAQGAVAALVGLTLTVPSFAAPSIRTELDGRPLQFDQPAVFQGGRVMVPLRGIFESLGAEVKYDGARRAITAVRGDRIVELVLGQREASVNGQPTVLDVPADTLNGRTYVPLRFVSEALGAEVKWMPANLTVALTSPVAAANPAPAASQPLPTQLQITSLSHDGRGNLQPGEKVHITLLGTPGAQASYDIEGVATQRPLREVASGRYEGDFVVERNMQARRAEVVGFLTLNGRSVELDARRPLNLAGQAQSGASAQSFTVYPAEGAVVQNLRPTIQVDVAPRLNLAATQVFLDGRDVTPQSTILGSRISYLPSSDLAPGEHRLTLQSVDNSGRRLSRDTTFQVQAYSATPVMNLGLPQVVVDNLSNGAVVPPVFNVQGLTQPFAQVQVRTQMNRALIPGVLSLSDGVQTLTRNADAQGRFDIAIDASSVPTHTPILLEVSVSDAQGRVSSPTRLSLTRR